MRVSKSKILIIIALFVLSASIITVAGVPSSIDDKQERSDTNSSKQNLTQDVTWTPSNERSGAITTKRTTDAKTSKIEVIIELYPNASETTSKLAEYGVTVNLRQNNTLQGKIPRLNRTAVSAIPWVKNIRKPRSANPTTVSEGVPAISADVVHDRGVRGDNVKVGVIDTGFNLTNPEIADNVVDARSFTGDITNGGYSSHGTAVSEVVADTAPNASLYLSNVNTMVQFAAAIDWMLKNDVDVISVSLGWYQAPQDGTSLVSQKATEATENGVVFISSTGNDASRHWQSRFTDPDNDGWANIDGKNEANYLNEGSPFTSSIDVYLTWNDWKKPSEDYNLYLFKEGQTEPIARSTRDQRGGADPIEHVSWTATERTQYYITVRNYDASGNETLEVFSAHSDLLVKTPTSSMVAPSVAVNATSVGAFNYQSFTAEPFSSRGPTNDGRRGPLISGPDGITTTAISPFYGTSASAPHVAGVVALMKAKNPDLTPAKVNSILGSTAVDMGPKGYDNISGHGRVDATAAVLKSGANIQATDFTLSDTTVQVTEPVFVNATVKNTGLIGGNETLSLRVNGTVTENKSVTLAPNETTTVMFETTYNTVGTHSISVDGLESQRLSVTNTTTGQVLFENQTVTKGDDTITLASTKASLNYYVGITNKNGTILGKTSTFNPHTTHEEITIELNQNLTTSQTLAATVYGAANDSKIATDLATVSVIDSDGITVSLEPPSKSIGNNIKTQYEVVLNGTDNGIASYEFDVAIKNPKIAAITTVSPVGTSIDDSLTRVDIDKNGSVAHVATAAPDVNGTTIGILTVEGIANGTTNLSITDVTVGDTSANSYSVRQTVDASITVEERETPAIVGSNPVQDLDNDGTYEDVNGDGAFNIVDVSAMFQKYDRNVVQDNRELFDFNDDGSVNIVDVSSLFQQAI